MSKKINIKTAKRYTLDGSTETFVPLRVIVLQPNLELDGLDKVALLLAIGIAQEFLDGAPHA
jgi:hypothetical protein